jgi:hypothetical protein
MKHSDQARHESISGLGAAILRVKDPDGESIAVCWTSKLQPPSRGVLIDYEHSA